MCVHIDIHVPLNTRLHVYTRFTRTNKHAHNKIDYLDGLRLACIVGPDKYPPVITKMKPKRKTGEKLGMEAIAPTPTVTAQPGTLMPTLQQRKQAEVRMEVGLALVCGSLELIIDLFLVRCCAYTFNRWK